MATSSDLPAEFPYPTIRKPVFGEQMVIASQPLAAQAGLRMLEEGGNAVDAAVAAAAAIAVVEPTNNGIGGDAFAQVWDGATLYGLNATGRAPLHVDMKALSDAPRMPVRGWASVTVPGAVSAWAALWRRFGTLPFERLLEPAIRYAKNGFHVSPGVAQKWAEQADVLCGQPGFSANFLPGGQAPAAGERFRQPELAGTLARIASTCGDDFYRGETARRIARFSADCGAALGLDDLASHEADWQEPLRGRFRDTSVCEMPPNGQGLIALFALAVLDRFDLACLPADSAAAIHLQIEAIKIAFAEVAPRIGDPDAMILAPMDLLHPDRVARAASRIDPRAAQDFGHALTPLAGTVYLAAGDAGGMMVSFIQSNYMGFGSGVVVPGTGIALQNRGACFSVDPLSPARIGPGRRPFHTILPGFLMQEHAGPCAFGATGGAFQPQGHVQLVARLAAHGQNPQAIVDAPRFKIGNGKRVVLEPGFSEATKQELASLGHDVIAQTTSSWDFGGMQILLRRDGHYVGAADSRRDSHVAVL